MKNNQEKLTDAFGMLREDTLNACVTDTPAAYPAAARGVTRRRVAVLLAACLTFALLTTALIALPFLRSEEPAVPADTTEGTPAADPLAGLSWYDEPLVNVQVLAVDNTDVSDLKMIDTQDISVVLGNDLVHQQVYVLFNMNQGETLTATSHNAKIAYTTLLDVDTDTQKYETWEKKFLKYVSLHWTQISTVDHRIEIDSPEAFLTWGGNRYYSENPLVFTPDEEFIDFVLRDADGYITGAGSVYLGNRKLVQNTESRYYDPVSISRAKVLGSVRFNDPASVTEEQVNAFLESLHEKADGLQKTLFDDPTMGEKFVIALGDLINTRYNHLNGFAMGWGSSPYDNYIALTVYEEEGTEQRTTDYVLMEDGTWGEIERHLSFCKFCGIQVGACSHYQIENKRLLLTDGRFMDIISGVINNHGSRTLVEVTDTTFVPCSEYDLIKSILAHNSPMVDTVYQAYLGIKAELGEGVVPFEAIHAFHFRPDWNHLWHRYATLEVTDGNGEHHNYFICENGDYAELDSTHYDCEVCDFSTPSQDRMLGHEHGEISKVFVLTNGGAYVVKNGLQNGQPYAPEYIP